MTSDIRVDRPSPQADPAALREELIRQRLAGARGGRRTGIGRADRDQRLPVSFGQERLWFLNMLEPESPEYHVPLVVRLRGPLDVAAMSAACEQVVARHEILRTRYRLVDAEPVQVIDPARPVDLPVTDLSGLPAGERLDRAVELARQDTGLPFDLSLEHPLRMRLVRLTPEDHVLVAVFHHIATDGWSLNLFINDLGACYVAAVSGQQPVLPPLPVQYADYAVWQRDRLSGARLAEHLGYWREQLADLTPLELPTDRPRPAVRSWAGDRVVFGVPAEVADGLRELARQHDATLFGVALTAFQVLLSRYTGQRDVAVGSAVIGRDRTELRDCIGFFLNTVVLRARWRGDPAFTDLLATNRGAVLDAVEHQEAPVQLLVDDTDRQRDLSRTPLFQVMFDMAEAPPAGARLLDLDVQPIDLTVPASKHDLRLELAELPDATLRGVLEYPTALFDASTAGRMVDHFQRLLAAVVADPAAPVSELEILDPAERHRLLTEWNDTAAVQPFTPVVAQIAAQAAATPDAPAVTIGAARLSYAELDAAANRIARHLIEHGVGQESVVAVCLDRGPDLLPALLGVWKAGAAYLPLDPADPPERLGHLLADCGAAAVLTSSEHADLLPAEHLAGRLVVELDTDRAAIDARPAGDVTVPIDPESLAYLIYTSGSTGRPKGVMVSHRAVANYLGWASKRYLAAGGNGAPLFSSIAFDMVVTTLYAPLLAGQPVHLVPPDVEVGQLGAALASGAPYGFVKLTPGHLELLGQQLDAAQAAGLAGHLVVGGEAFTSRLLARWRELAVGARTVLVNEYGPTENTVANCVFAAEPDTPPGAAEVLPIGRPTANTTAFVLDGELRPVPVGVVGELHLGGVQLARGYRNLPDRTAERFVPNPYGPPGSRLYRTGDLARVLPGGDIEFLGRRDEQVKVRGYRVETAEIVTALRRHPDVLDAVVILRPSGSLAAYLVPAGGAAQAPALAPDELRAFLEPTLPHYMLPAAYLPVDRIPLTANGKVDHRALPDPDRDSLRPDADCIAPRTPLEEQIAAAWCDVLSLDRVGVHDSFFDLGGDSLSAVALVGLLRDAGLDLAVQDVFEHSTIAQLGELLAQRPGAAPTAPGVRPFELLSAEDRARVPDGIADAYPLSLLQTGMVYEMLGASGVNYYHNATTYTIRDDRPFSLPALRAAVAVLVERHEVLRTGIEVAGYSEPLQLVHRTAELQVDAQDLRELSALEQDQAVRRYMAQERTRLFDLTSPSLLRMFAHVRTETVWSLTITECHPILEGWSYHVLLMELLDCYRQLRDGAQPPPWQPPAIRYADFIAAERASLASEEDRGFWRRTIERSARFALPASWAAGPHESPEPYRLEVMFADLEEDLRTLAKRAEAPFKSVMHAAHLKVLSMLTEEPAFFTGLVCDTRPEVLGADRLPGLFLNVVPFEFRSTARTWRELVRDVFAQEVELWSHRRFPMLAMQRDFAGGRRLVEVMFNYLDFRIVDMDLIDFAASIDDSPNEFRLAVTVFRQGLLNLRIHPDAVSRANGERLAAMYRFVLKAMAADPDGDAWATHLPAEERRQIAESNHTDVLWPAVTLHGLFERQARAVPDAVAVVATDGQRLSYTELDRRANQLAHHLRGLGVGPEVFVGICAEHSVELLVGLLGILKAGGAYLPLDPDHPADRLAFALADTEAPVVLTQAHLDDVLPSTAAHLVYLDDDWPQIEGYPDGPPAAHTDPDNLVYTMYTSGSTGRPKGVLISHRALVNYLLWAIDGYGLQGASGAAMLGSIAFDLSVPNFFLPLIGGRDVTLLPPGRQLEALADLLLRPGDFSLLKITPAHLEMLRGLLPDGATVDSVRTFVVGAEHLPAPSAVEWRKRVRQARIINEYGPTETVVGCSIYDVPPDQDPSALVPIGRPIANIRMYVLDRNLHQVPVGVVGELYIGGAGVARGYLNRPDLTADKFLPDPYCPTSGARFYRTGDLARWRPDGNLEFLGRTDHQIKIHGYRIEPGEVEARLLQHPDVADAVVVAREDRPGEKRLVGYVARADGREPQISVLREFARETLPEYLVPTVVVVLDELPRTAAGKVDRRALPAPDGSRPDLDVGYVRPRNSTERRLAEIWRRVLGVDRIGVHDDLQDLGADSLSGLRVAAEARDLGFTMSPMDAISYPTIAELAGHLLGGTREDMVAEMVRDARLDPAIRPAEGAPAAAADAPVLLTGATGFVGAFLLHELLTGTDHRVLCLVRAEDDDQAGRRLRGVLSDWGLLDGAHLQRAFAERVEALAGDLTLPNLGLDPRTYQRVADTVGAIYHNGASVNAVYSYRSMRPSNVYGTTEILRLACTGPVKHVHHVSTLSVFPDELFDAGTIDEDTVTDAPPYPSNGYAQSKWVAETLVREACTRGLPTTVYRMGKVSWHSRSGWYNPRDLVTHFIAACVELGAAPDAKYAMTLTPVEHVAAAIVQLAARPEAPGRAFHIVNRHRVSWREIVEWINEAGCELRLVEYLPWRRQLIERSETPAGAHLKPLLLMLPGEDDGFDVEHGLVDDYVPAAPTLADRTGLPCPPVGPAAFASLVDRLRRIPAPVEG